MSVDFANSETKKNLMRAFAGESQASMRYTFAASEAQRQKNHVVNAIFTFTANQEKQHAKRFYKFLNDLNGETITIDGTYPVNLSDDLVELLAAAEHNEFEEHDDIYQAFGKKAEEEGFPQIASVFLMIAEIEKCHGNRFGYMKKLIEEDKLFISGVKTGWMCLNCGFVVENSTMAPKLCPVCDHPQGYFIRLELAPYEIIPKES